jgi:hypothetical protein
MAVSLATKLLPSQSAFSRLLAELSVVVVHPRTPSCLPLQPSRLRMLALFPVIKASQDDVAAALLVPAGKRPDSGATLLLSATTATSATAL